MTEEVVVEPEVEDVKYVEEFDPESPTDTQARALQMGWKPEGIEGKRAKTSDEFVEYRDFVDQIQGLKKSLRNKDTTVDALTKDFQRMQERIIVQQKADLRAKRREAIDDQDHVEIDRIDNEIEKLNKEVVTTVPPVDPQAEVNDALAAWAPGNSWYETDPELAIYANGYIQTLANDASLTFAEKLEKVTERVKERHPEKFGIKSRNAPPPVEGSQQGRKGKNAPKFSMKDVPEQDRKIANTLIRDGITTEEKWLETYFND
jgi:hypothetical protein